MLDIINIACMCIQHFFSLLKREREEIMLRDTIL